MIPSQSLKAYFQSQFIIKLVYLWILIDLLRVLLVTVYVKSDSCTSTACPAETEDDTRTITKDDPQALGKKKTWIAWIMGKELDSFANHKQQIHFT